MFASRRLGKELAKIHDKLPPGIQLVKADNFEEWQMDIKVLDDNPIYKDETYRLKFHFPKNYPIEPPEVVFLNVATPQPTPSSNGAAASSQPTTSSSSQSEPTPDPKALSPGPRPIPLHPHIYSNGFICLDLLGTAGWSPVQTVESVCMSIQSMLTGNTKRERPQGDEEFVRRNRARPKDVRFVYDDESV